MRLSVFYAIFAICSFIVLIAGVNGVGKSTLYQTLDSLKMIERVNTDEIKSGIEKKLSTLSGLRAWGV